MKNFVRPVDEQERLVELARLNLISGESEERFDRITRIAQRMFAVPMADFSLIDANLQRVISASGFEASFLSRDISLASHALLKNDVFVVPDTLQDVRFRGNPLVLDRPHIRFFAAMPVHSKAGFRVGTLSIADRIARSFSAQDQSIIRDLAEMIENEIAFLQVSMFDRQTRLAINEGFFSRAEQGLRACQRDRTRAIALVFDVRQLNAANDPNARIQKDHRIKAFAQQLRSCFRQSDIVGRLEDEAFTALLLNAGPEHVNDIVAKLQHSVDRFNMTNSDQDKLMFRHGSAQFDPQHPVSPDALVSMASRALQRLSDVV